ncbi:MAG: OB-fold nucleic acid binding domain-containing protein, partial [Chloroflexota bacterium]|nr:OB-fold nucleic acid binding domain-containing protein [Chloroflexota bacterium]
MPAPNRVQVKEQFVRDLSVDDQVVDFFLVKHKELEWFRDRTRGQFLTLVLMDRTGEILARVWEQGPELAEVFDEGDVVKVQGEVEEYRDRRQIIVERLRLAEPEEYTLEDFLPSTERDVEAMWRTLERAIEGLENPHLQALCRAVYEDEGFAASFKRAPAARRIHHAYLGGLLEHVAELLVLARPLCRLFPDIDCDLLTSGILLHDIGKVREFTYEREINYSDEGRLLGHVLLSYEMLMGHLACLDDFPQELALRLRHMVLSHHGRYEWGSPRRPKTLEACALHYLDNLDAQVNRFQ